MAIYYLIVLDRQVIISRSPFQIGLDLHAVLQSVLAYQLHTHSLLSVWFVNQFIKFVRHVRIYIKDLARLTFDES